MYSTDHKQLNVCSRLTCEGGASACERSMQHSQVAYKYSRVVYKCAHVSVSRRARRFCEHMRVNVVCDLYCKSGTSCCYANILLLAAFSGSNPWIGSNRSKISSYRTYSTAHVKGKHYTRVSHGLHAGYTQIDNTSHTCDYLGARRLHACYMQHARHVWISTPVQPTVL